MLEEGWVRCRDCTCQASSSGPVKGAAEGLSFPLALRCKIRGSDSHLFIQAAFCLFKGAGWHVRGSLKGRDLQAMGSSGQAVIIWPSLL